MKSIYLTHEEMIARGDLAVMRAKKELAQEISVEKKYSQSYNIHA